jgi:hypothetical protein
MNANDNVDHDICLQAEAERAEREGLPSGRDPRVDRYRLVVRALRRPLEPQLPHDFDARVAELALRRDGDGFEDIMVSLLLLAMGVGALLFVGPSLAAMARSIVAIQLPQFPWQQIAMAAVAIVVVWAIERGWTRSHPSARPF